MRSLCLFCMVLLICGCRSVSSNSEISDVRMESPPVSGSNRVYVGNQQPLLADPLLKLPIGAIEPRGWILSQLELMREGFVGHLSEISKYITPESGWHTGKGKGWEELPYWLRGYGDLAYVLKDGRMAAQAAQWLNASLASQDEDGYFGPPENKARHDLWPNMVMINAFQSRYEATGEQGILDFMTRYFKYQSSLPDGHLIPGSWQKFRGGENLQSILWIYNRTEDRSLLELARRVYEKTSDWKSPILNADRDRQSRPSEFYHGVNIAMGFRYPAIDYPLSKNPENLEAVKRNLAAILESYGQPGGLFGADENIRPGKSDPRQGIETCTMVEYMHSCETLLKITGDPVWAERCEDVAFNSLPASMTPDLKGLHYLTAANLIACDTLDHDFENQGDMLSFTPWKYRCCQHNVAFGWPYYAEHLWFATRDNGLAAALFAPCRVQARVSNGGSVSIVEETDYPFDETVTLKFETEAPVKFALYLRIPSWCTNPSLAINDEDAPEPGQGFVRIERTWRNGDRVRLNLPMAVEVRSWPKWNGAISIRRGPLWYSLKIEEDWDRIGGTDRWPAYRVTAKSPWNYALDPQAIDSGKVHVSFRDMPYQPFVSYESPVELTIIGRRLPSWKADGTMAGLLPKGSGRSSQPDETLTLIPMGCARLRISVFPRLNAESRIP